MESRHQRSSIIPSKIITKSGIKQCWGKDRFAGSAAAINPAKICSSQNWHSQNWATCQNLAQKNCPSHKFGPAKIWPSKQVDKIGPAKFCLGQFWLLAQFQAFTQHQNKAVVKLFDHKCVISQRKTAKKLNFFYL